jgi:SAM-dependent methyltransferase
MMSGAGDYQGSELELFRHARNWKAYLRRRLTPLLKGDVVEVGAGLGASTRALVGPEVTSWLCLEPDREMLELVASQVDAGELPAICRAQCGTLADTPETPAFDVVLYVDVLEHIEDDAGELVNAARRLRTGGRIVVMSPAGQWLYSPFDAAIGHFRRYRRADVRGLTPPGTTVESVTFLDSVGLAASAANKLILRASMPTLGQVVTWDRLMVPASRLLDPLLGHSFGRSVLFVWRKSA